MNKSRTSTRAHVGLAAGPLLFAAMLFLPPPEGMAILAWRTAAVGVLMAIWWINHGDQVAMSSIPLRVARQFLE